AGQQDLLLQAAPAAAIEECLRVLEVLVLRYHRTGDFTGFDWPPIKSCNDSNHIRRDPLQFQLQRTHPVLRRGRRSNHVEERRVDTIGAGSDDAELTAFLAAVD